jgi:tetratricopeptide (TPR) repeat protein
MAVMESNVTVEDKGSKERLGYAALGATTAEARALALATRLAEDLAAAWRRGNRPVAEEFLAVAPDLAAFPEAVLALVHEEICRRREFGPPPDLDEYQRRFPKRADQLPFLFESDSALSRSPESFIFPSCGETVIDCQLLAELGRGAQGRVFLATQTSLADRLVVLKMGPRDCHEHLALARLLHTHIVPLHFVQDLPVHNLRVLCMPYLGGATLAQLREELRAVPTADRTGRDLLDALDSLQASRPGAASTAGPGRARLAEYSWTEAVCWLAACLADALQYAHERGMLHLDLKPSNVLLAGDGQPMLLDFHLARPPLPAGALPPGWFGGTPGRMSPEQRLALEAVRARRPIPAPLNARSDIYSLGVVLFEMLGGEPTSHALKHARSALIRANREVSRGLADVIAQCVAVDPARRYQEAGTLADDLRRHLAHQPLIGAPNRSLWERWRKWRLRQPHGLARAGLVLFLAAAFAGCLALGWAYYKSQRHDAEAALVEGEGLLRRGLPAEAEQSLQRGRELTGRAPWLGGLAHALDDAQGRARRALLAQELHHTADDLRFRCDPDGLSSHAAAELETACGRVWEARKELMDASAGAPASPEEEQIRTDLRDLALLWVGLRDQVEGGENVEMRRWDLEVLEEAETLFGPSAALRYERIHRGGEAADARPPRTAWDHYALGRALLRDGKTADAAGELDKAVEVQPQGFWPNFYSGVCAYRGSRYVEAEAAFRVCTALAPECAPCYCNHGLAMVSLNRPERARADFDRAVHLDPNRGDAWLNRGVLDYREKRWGLALEDLRQALAHGADPAAAHYNLALTFQARGENAEAVKETQAALFVRPDHTGARALLRELQGG